MPTILKAARLIDGTGRPPLDNPVILIEDGRIKAVEGGEAELGLETVRVVNFPEKTIIPGMIDAHVHLLFDTAITDREEARRRIVGDSDVRLGLLGLRNAQAALSAGVTTLADCGGRGLIALEVRDAIAAGLVVGPRVRACGPPITTTNGHLHYVGYHADSAHELRKAVRTLIRDGADHIKIMATGGNMTRGTNPTTAQYSTEELKCAVDEAHRVGRRVVAHAHGAPGVRNAIVAGIDTIEHCKWMSEMRGRAYEPRLRQELGQGASYWKPPGRDIDGRLVEQMAEQGTVVDLTFASPRRILIPRNNTTAEEQQARREELRDLHAHYRLMKDAGVTVIVSSDAGAAGTKFEEFALGAVGAVEAGVLTPREAVEAVTRLAAEALGLQQDIGTVEPGKCADLVVVDGNPLEDLWCLTRVDCVVAGGRPVVRDGTMAREWSEAAW